jgi:antitoxin component of RelBE/YafQ-DinJ toxin-antitoxin module
MSAETIEILGTVLDDEGKPLSKVDVVITSPSINDTLTSDRKGNWSKTYPVTDVISESIDIVFSKEGYTTQNLSNLRPAQNGKLQITRIQLVKVTDPISPATNTLIQETNKEEIKQFPKPLPNPAVKLATIANTSKEEIKRRIIPAILKLLLPFGSIVIQAIIKKIPLNKIKTQCPTNSKLLDIIKKRNKLAKQINNIYKTVKTLTTVLNITNVLITATQAALISINVIPLPAPPSINFVINFLEEKVKKEKAGLDVVTTVLSSLGIVLALILKLLEALDSLTQKCAQEQNIPFEVINVELNNFVNTSTGVSNSVVIGKDNTYKGFTLEIKLDETSTNKYPLRFAQALNIQGVPVLKTEKSFASDPQVLLDELKFIIDSNPNLTAK